MATKDSNEADSAPQHLPNKSHGMRKCVGAMAFDIRLRAICDPAVQPLPVDLWLYPGSYLHETKLSLIFSKSVANKSQAASTAERVTT
jgi:hypothetical protein